MAGLPQGRVTNDPSNYIAIALQSAKDTDGTTFYFLKHLDGSGFDVSTDYSSERLGGAGREVALRYRTKVTADGQVAAYADPDFIGRILYGVLGTDTVTQASLGVGASLYNHVIVSGQSVLPYYTVEQAWADETERTTNCLWSDVKLEGNAGKPVMVTAQFISGGTPHTQGTTLSPTRESNPVPFMIPGGSVAITATGGLSSGVGATSLQVSKWSIDIKNTLDDGIQTVALNREDVTWLNLDIDIDGTFKYTNKTFWEAVQYGGASQVPTGALTSGAFTFFTQLPSTPSLGGLKLFAPYVEFTALKVNRLDPDGKTMWIDYTASTKNIGTQSLQTTVTNLTSTAYSSTST